MPVDYLKDNSKKTKLRLYRSQGSQYVSLRIEEENGSAKEIRVTKWELMEAVKVVLNVEYV